MSTGGSRKIPVNDLLPIHGVAIDAGSGLEAQLAKARGSSAKPGDLLTFKRAVVSALGPYASTVLVDACLGPGLLDEYPVGCTRMMAYEADVYHVSDADRITILPEKLNISDFSGLDVPLLKFFMYYGPNDDVALNRRKQDIVQGIGEQCSQNGLRFLMEPLVYDRDIAQGTAEYARLKPDLVGHATKVFADPRFKVDVLKVEIPVDLAFVQGFGRPIFSRLQALTAFRSAAAAAGNVPLVYLSAGVPFDWFEASLKMAGDAGVDFSGFMCGRAIWSDAVDLFGQKGEDALKGWLEDVGVRRLKRLIAAL